MEDGAEKARKYGRLRWAKVTCSEEGKDGGGGGIRRAKTKGEVIR